MKKIYLDNAATTKVDSEVAKKVAEMFVKNYGNASSQHSVGREAKEKLIEAREKIAKFVGCEASEIVFTSGGTESNNLALKGLALANPEKKHIVTSMIEHPSILETCKALEKQGCGDLLKKPCKTESSQSDSSESNFRNSSYEVDYVKVGTDGVVDVKEVEKLIRDDTLVVSVMHVNNEIGTVQPVEEIAKVCKKKCVYFHTDAVQGFTKIDLDLKDIDLMSVSGHKVHAPKGVGFLYVKKGVGISAIISGGGQEGGLRSGTENVPGIVGLAAALNVKTDKKKIEKIRDSMIEKLLEIPGAKINGSMESRVYNNINVSFYGIEGESLMLMLDEEGVYVSTGSACASTKLAESYVLKAIGVEELYIHGSLRLTLGEITEKEVDFVVKTIKEKVEKLREISPFKFDEEEMK